MHLAQNSHCFAALATLLHISQQSHICRAVAFKLLSICWFTTARASCHTSGVKPVVCMRFSSTISLTIVTLYWHNALACFTCLTSGGSNDIYTSQVAILIWAGKASTKHSWKARKSWYMPSRSECIPQVKATLKWLVASLITMEQLCCKVSSWPCWIKLWASASCLRSTPR